MDIDGVDVVLTETVLRDLQVAFPDITVARIRATLLSEWEASSGGVPLVVPADLLHAVRQSLRGAPIVDIRSLVRS